MSLLESRTASAFGANTESDRPFGRHLGRYNLRRSRTSAVLSGGKTWHRQRRCTGEDSDQSEFSHDEHRSKKGENGRFDIANHRLAPTGAGRLVVCRSAPVVCSAATIFCNCATSDRTSSGPSALSSRRRTASLVRQSSPKTFDPLGVSETLGRGRRWGAAGTRSAVYAPGEPASPAMCSGRTTFATPVLAATGHHPRSIPRGRRTDRR